ncbi:MAG: hypothetical protein AAFP19_07970 [Bacteroidota bacterium]
MKQLLLISGLLFTFLMLFQAFSNQQNSEEQDIGWQLVFKNDANGKSLYGDKQLLMDAVRKGYPVRIGYGRQRPNDPNISVEHVGDAAFLSITNNQEVFGQIPMIIGQKPFLNNNDSIRINFHEHRRWAMIAGTNGYSDRMMFDVRKDSVLSHRSRYAAFSWYVYYSKSSGAATEKVGPLWQK